MTAQKKNQVLLLALFGLLAVNSTWVQDFLSGQPTQFLELSSNDGVQLTDCIENGDTRTCTARISTRGSRPTQTASGRTRTNNEAAAPETREFTITIQRNATRPADTSAGITSLTDLARTTPPAAGTPQTGTIVTLEAGSCSDCFRRSFVPGNTEQTAQGVVQQIRNFAQEIARRTQQEAETNRRIEGFERQVVACTHEYVDEGDLSRGVRAISTQTERAECLANNLKNGDIGDLTAKQYFERHIRSFFESLARGGERGRQIARAHFQEWSAGDGGATEEMRAWADGWMGFTHYAQRLTDLARDAQDGRINRQQYSHYLNQEMELAQMQFGAFGRQHGGAFSAEFSQRYRELQNVGRMMLNDPRSGLARLEGDGRSMYGSNDRFSYDGSRLDALYGSADRYSRRGDYGGTAYGSANGRFAGVSRERVDLGRGFRLPTGRGTQSRDAYRTRADSTRRYETGRGARGRDSRYDSRDSRYYNNDRYSFNEGRRY